MAHVDEWVDSCRKGKHRRLAGWMAEGMWMVKRTRLQQVRTGDWIHTKPGFTLC